MAQGLDSKSTSNLTRPAKQCTCVYTTKHLIKMLAHADKTPALHSKLIGHDINMVGKLKQVHVLTAKLVSVRHNHGFFVSIKSMTGFTYVCICHLLVITRE